MNGNPTHTEAVMMVRAFVLAVQKARSTMAESLGAGEENPVAEEALVELQPWLFGPKCILPVAEKLLREAEQTGTVSPVALMNLYQVLRFAPALAARFATWGQPDAFNFAWLRGWSGEPDARQATERRERIPHADGRTQVDPG